MNLQTMEAMKRGSEALKGIHGKMCVVALHEPPAARSEPRHSTVLFSLVGTSIRSTPRWIPSESRWSLRTRFRKPSLTRRVSRTTPTRSVVERACALPPRGPWMIGVTRCPPCCVVPRFALTVSRLRSRPPGGPQSRARGLGAGAAQRPAAWRRARARPLAFDSRPGLQLPGR